jgi:hypothetical protein
MVESGNSKKRHHFPVVPTRVAARCVLRKRTPVESGGVIWKLHVR